MIQNTFVILIIRQRKIFGEIRDDTRPMILKGKKSWKYLIWLFQDGLNLWYISYKLTNLLTNLQISGQ